MKAVVRLLKIVIGLFTFTVIVIGGMTAIPGMLGYMPCIILSGSMHPQIETGSIAYIDTKDTDCGIGDIITYQLSADRGREKLVTHRIVGRKDGGYITKGDANDVEDTNVVYQGQVIGRYRWHIPKLGYLQAKITSKIKRVALAWIVVLNFGMCVFSAFFEPDASENAEAAAEEKKPESHEA